jgi:hypothetical protein
MVARSSGRRVDCADIPASGRAGASFQEAALGLFEGRDRRRVAVVVTSDGRRIQVPLTDNGLVDASLFGILRALLVGLDGLLGLITGSRRENGGTRRNERG